MAGNLTKSAVAIGAMLLVAACSSDNGSFGGGGGGGGGPSPSSVTSLGVTGKGGVTEALGVAALTDPLLGTEGVLGGGGEGAIGGLLPEQLTDALKPVANGLKPVVDGISGAVPLDMVTDNIPALGLGGAGGLTQDLLGQDVVTMLLGKTGTIPALVGGGNDGALGNIIPAGLIPVPGGGGGGGVPGLDGLPVVGDLLGALPVPGLPGGGGGGGVPGLDGLPLVGDLLGGLPVPGLPGGGSGGFGGLGVTQQGGLVADLIGQDPIGPLLAPLPPVAALVGGGNDGLVGDIVPAGVLPVPGGGGAGNPLAPITGLLGGLGR